MTALIRAAQGGEFFAGLKALRKLLDTARSEHLLTDPDPVSAQRFLRVSNDLQELLETRLAQTLSEATPDPAVIAWFHRLLLLRNEFLEHFASLLEDPSTATDTTRIAEMAAHGSDRHMLTLALDHARKGQVDVARAFVQNVCARNDRTRRTSLHLLLQLITPGTKWEPVDIASPKRDTWRDLFRRTIAYRYPSSDRERRWLRLEETIERHGDDIEVGLNDEKERLILEQILGESATRDEGTRLSSTPQELESDVHDDSGVAFRRTPHMDVSPRNPRPDTELAVTVWIDLDEARPHEGSDDVQFMLPSGISEISLEVQLHTSRHLRVLSNPTVPLRVGRGERGSRPVAFRVHVRHAERLGAMQHDEATP